MCYYLKGPIVRRLSNGAPESDNTYSNKLWSSYARHVLATGNKLDGEEDVSMFKDFSVKWTVMYGEAL